MKTILCTCQQDHKVNKFDKVRSQYKISKIGKLPNVVTESSGLARDLSRKSYWTHNDSGGLPELYEIDSTGNYLSQKVIPGAINVDWEDLSQGPGNSIFIGDIGNNSNQRKDLVIYKVNIDPKNNNETEIGKIEFSYADQKQFPPPAESLNFDSEAFFYFREKLYLFSKNRSRNNHFVKLYALPAQEGRYVTSPADSISVGTQVTSADVSPDGKTFALLTYGKILLFRIEQDMVNFRHPVGCFRFVHKQAEAIVFINNHDLMVSNEQGQLFRITRR
ncbi:hypothetical protein DYBT9275_05111 [Dyadobacter sp. CECT 9275]|uniref:Uncharacterized protein n=1 Tax=Dyadobacter helix TaxID=2822344 RepID=A0A916JJS5_9BACT|nr:hypothetical protein [Dyadobacter sp. CECT 9275]CAG5012122.1 hypothetical protein DYBT9275_05111 [Dyadobacter sp. CECT 9275]